MAQLMNDLDRQVRAAVYALFQGGEGRVEPIAVAELLQFELDVVEGSFARLESEHRLLVDDDGSVRMAHPFSGVDTGHTATVNGVEYRANCAWDALAILALLGDGVAHCPNGPIWTVTEGEVSPGGVIRLTIPAAQFWDDIVHT